ncbi:hypothetical protein DAEQUDRAFT_411106 [Daedalea quercina L-15889]|uniref:Uncharacterized protein n=1 Tax=Daedalea quercina L-15889 TaxID=1314783 RepID=A0A165NL69_9APHY|nr:hypothetical protein DAEQUDRAFT_411106 [Daedalea quercina L-15889]
MSIYSAVGCLDHASQDHELVFHLGTCATYISLRARCYGLATLSTLDPTVKLASRVGHLTIDMLRPLADYDDAQNMTKRSMGELDPLLVKKKGRYVMWGLLGIFRSDWIVLTIITIFNVRRKRAQSRLARCLD